MDRHETIICELLTWIDENIRSPLKIEDVAQRSGYSKWHLQRMFHAHHEYQPWQLYS